MISKPEFNEIVQRAWSRVSSATGLTDNSESAFGANIVRVLAQELSLLWDELAYTESQGLLSSATGVNLDKLGQFFGVSRRSAVASTTIGGPQSVKFTNNGGTTVQIPTNTRVWSDDNPNISYFTAAQISIAAGQQGYADVRAASAGEFYNVAANKLTSHNAGISTVSVTNELPITNGTDIESDASYRLRIQAEIYRKEGSNLTAVRQELLKVPGVRDVQIINLSRGTGTLDVLIYGFDRVVPQNVVDECQRVLEDSVAAGVSAIAKGPITKFVDVEVKLRLTQSGVFSQVRSAVSSTIRGYLDNLQIEQGTGNGTLVFNELAARIQEASSEIIDSDVKLTIDGIPSLKANQTPEVGERIVSRVISIT